MRKYHPQKSRHPFLPHLCKLHYQPEFRIIDPCGLIITDANNIGWHIAILYSVQALYQTSKIMFVLVHKTSDFPELYWYTMSVFSSKLIHKLSNINKTYWPWAFRCCTHILLQFCHIEWINTSDMEKYIYKYQENYSFDTKNRSHEL